MTGNGTPIREMSNIWGEDYEQAWKSIEESLPKYHSTKGMTWQQEIQDKYDPQSAWPVAGGVATGVGTILPFLPAGQLAPVFSFLSTAGNSSVQAQEAGVDFEDAYLYGLSTGALNTVIDMVSGGIGGIGKGYLDDLIDPLAHRVIGSLGKDFVRVGGEFAEGYVSEVGDAFLQKIWNGDESGFWDTLAAAQPTALNSAFQDLLLSAVLRTPGRVRQGLEYVQNSSGQRTASPDVHGQQSVQGFLRRPLDSYSGMEDNGNVNSDTDLSQIKSQQEPDEVLAAHL
ncbi:hypothetical protein [uncultured Ruthenibacterium sp.]|uniref:hypothetical protein n=1 Tax=uncultured Ruthenibacterium sp. TaxID=1905347 RepID=UPI00349F028F